MQIQMNKQFTRETVVKSTRGKFRSAIAIYVMALKYLKDHLHQRIRKQVPGIAKDENSMKWVLTVPALCPEQTVQILAEAAVSAGLADKVGSDQLVFVNEPEMASYYCCSQQVGHLGADSSSKDVSFPPGTKYMVVDAGGGTVDITLHKIKESGEIQCLATPICLSSGGLQVDEAFVSLIKEIFNEDVIDNYKEQYPHNWLNLVSTFEKKKKAITTDYNTLLDIPIPRSMENFIKEKTGKELNDLCRQSGRGLQFENELLLSQDVMEGLFRPVISKIVSKVRHELESKALTESLDYIILVGGFGECDLLRNEFLKNVGDKIHVITPAGASIAVLKGAVMYGLKITPSVQRKSWSTRFPPMHFHPLLVNITTDDLHCNPKVESDSKGFPTKVRTRGTDTTPQEATELETRQETTATTENDVKPISLKQLYSELRKKMNSTSPVPAFVIMMTHNERKICIDVKKGTHLEAMQYFQRCFKDAVPYLSIKEQEMPRIFGSGRGRWPLKRFQSGSLIMNDKYNILSEIKCEEKSCNIAELIGKCPAPVVGTLGFFMEDTEGNTYAISANHVIHYIVPSIEVDGKPTLGNPEPEFKSFKENNAMVVSEKEAECVVISEKNCGGCCSFKEGLMVDICAMAIKPEVIQDINAVYTSDVGKSIQLKTFRGGDEDLMKQDVMKYGQKTDVTFGSVIFTDSTLSYMIDGQTQFLTGNFLVDHSKMQDKSIDVFSKDGDSGSLIIGEKADTDGFTFAYGILHGAFEKYERHDDCEDPTKKTILKNLAICTRLDYGLDFMKQEHHLDLEWINKVNPPPGAVFEKIL